jgi:pimeloyl-ACP methyl ester carboxylesterase
MRRLVAIAAVALAVAPSASAKLPLRPCFVSGANGLCGRLAVPENRARPQGRKIALRVMVLQAVLPHPRPDPLFYLIGGPGLPATYDAQAMQRTFATVNQDHDIVLVDQRGTGASNALACPKPPAFETRKQAVAWVRSCTSAARLGGDARRYGTVDAADDLEAVRKALGYGKIDLYGVSYGTVVEQVFMNRHPRSVRAVVLDGSTLIDIPVWERFGSNGQLALDRIAKRCAAEPGCAKAFPRWEDGLPRLLAHLDAKPLARKVEGQTVQLDGTGAAATIQSMSQNVVQAAAIPFVVFRAERGDYGPLAAAALQPSFASAPPAAIMPYSVMCNEPWARWSVAKAAADAKGTYLAKAAVADAQRIQLICAGFPKRSESPADWHRPRLDVPLLALVGADDPQNPVRNISGIKEGVPHARLVVVPAYAHVVGGIGCMPDLIERFLGRGSAQGLDVSCAHAIPPVPFRLS